MSCSSIQMLGSRSFWWPLAEIDKSADALHPIFEFFTNKGWTQLEFQSASTPEFVDRRDVCLQIELVVPIAAHFAVGQVQHGRIKGPFWKQANRRIAARPDQIGHRVS